MCKFYIFKKGAENCSFLCCEKKSRQKKLRLFGLFRHFIACIYGHCNVGDGSLCPSRRGLPRLLAQSGKTRSDPPVLSTYKARFTLFQPSSPRKGDRFSGGRSLLKALLQSRLRRASFLWEEALKRERKHRRGGICKCASVCRRRRDGWDLQACEAPLQASPRREWDSIQK